MKNKCLLPLHQLPVVMRKSPNKHLFVKALLRLKTIQRYFERLIAFPARQTLLPFHQA